MGIALPPTEKAHILTMGFWNRDQISESRINGQVLIKTNKDRHLGY